MSIYFVFLLVLFPLMLHLPPTNIPLSYISDAFSFASIKMHAEPLAEILWNSFLAEPDSILH